MKEITTSDNQMIVKIEENVLDLLQDIIYLSPPVATYRHNSYANERDSYIQKISLSVFFVICGF